MGIITHSYHAHRESITKLQRTDSNSRDNVLFVHILSLIIHVNSAFCSCMCMCYNSAAHVINPDIVGKRRPRLES